MSRTHIINSIVKHVKATKYLEIGISDGNNFSNIDCECKVGVDPELLTSATYHLTSDDFFKENKETFDVIFLDGLHHSDQLERDINNSLEILNENGIILCHDMIPISYEQQKIPYTTGKWTGDVWKTFVKFRQTREDLEMFTLDIDMGIGIIMKGKQKLLKLTEELTYENFEKRKFEWLNIMFLSDFYSNFLKQHPYSHILGQFIYNPEDDLINFYLGLEYHNDGQTAAAISFYLRSAERTEDILLKYECLLRGSMCFDTQGSRGNSVIGLLQHAVALLPNRPEAYYFLSRYYERTGKWFEGYMLASIGVKNIVTDLPKLRTDINYPGHYGLLFEKAVNGWWCGLCSESLDLLKNIAYNYILDEPHKKAVIKNLQNLGGWKTSNEFQSYLKTKSQEEIESQKTHTLYIKEVYSDVKTQFKGLEKISKNYSEAFQDMLVLTLLNGKRKGYYLEIGAGFPVYGNNTYLLETEFNWKGVSIDIELESIERYLHDRQNQALLRDATTADYKELLLQAKAPNTIDYLQLDCDPPENTYTALTKIPFDEYLFNVITYEHDHYKDSTGNYREKSRTYLKDKGYVLLISDISTNGKDTFEDWWIHPSLISPISTKLTDTSPLVKKAKNLFILS
jgi:hypothetical protein